MGDWSLVKDQKGIIGMWVKDAKDAQDRNLLSFLLISKNIPDEFLMIIETGHYRIIPNTYDDAGGCFIMFKNELAPGE